MKFTEQDLRDACARNPSLSRRNPEIANPASSPQPEQESMEWTESEIEMLKKHYELPDGEFSIDILAVRLNRSYIAVALKASRLGLTRKRTDPRAFSNAHIANLSIAQKERADRPEEKQLRSERQKRILKEGGHPRGFLGKHHSDSTKAKISAFHSGKKIPREQTVRQMKTRLANHGTLGPMWTRNASWKAGWVEVGGQRFYARSRWEANYARYLQWLLERGEISKWEHEPETFWFEGVKRGCVSYLPDFRVMTWTGSMEYHEVKGWMDKASATKLNRMVKYHPKVIMVLIDSKRYRALAKTCSKIIPGWA